MDWGFVIQVAFAILGAALIAGGIVAYRGSTRSSFRAFSAAAVAAGVVMWAVVLVTVPGSSAGTGPQDHMVTGVPAPTEPGTVDIP